ncbi:MAG: D-aminoacyl-tRNA deacylase, partial [Clostridiales bacterium]|nr:D-aminoacyl-tRNA deacylase [Clostridiales bacterium]
MKAVVQRVSSASVTVEGQITGQIGHGLMVLLGIAVDDREADLAYITKKILGLRVFDDEKGVPNLSVTDVGGSVLVVSQFTLY